MKKTKLLLFAFFILLFTNCEKEIYDDAIQADKKNFTFKTISFKELNKIDKKTSSKILELKSKKANNLLDKTSDMYGFLVDTTSIIHLEKENGFSSFSFRVEQNKSLSNFKNIVVENYPDGSQRVLSIKFNLTKPLLLIDTKNIANATTSVEVVNLSENNSNANRGAGGDCLTVGYYTTVDACQGELVTPGENPGCFNADGTRATREIFITLAEDCSDGSGGGDGGFNGNPNNPNSGGYNNDSNGGEVYNGYGIFIPNIYNGEADPNNAEFVLAGQIANYFNALPQNIKSLTSTNTWVYSYLVDYFRNNGNIVNGRNTPKATTALNNFYNFQLNSYSPSMSFIAHERLNFWAYYTFLNNNPANVNTQAVFNIRDYVIQATSSQNDDAIIDYLFNNYENPEAVEFVNELINLSVQNNIKFSFNNNIDYNNSLNFSNVAELEQYILNENYFAENIDFEDLNQNERMAKSKFSVGLFAINVFIKQKMLPSYSVENISTSKSGTTMFFDWEQIDYTVDVGNGSVVTTDIYGKSIQGIKIGTFTGLTIENIIHFRITLDKNTGKIITANEIDD